MGNIFSDWDESRKQDGLKEMRGYLNSRGIPLPTNDTESVPEYFEVNKDAQYYFPVLANDVTSQATKRRLYGQKFVIGNREPFSFAERKKKNIISPDNPFSTTQGEGEQMILDFVLANKDKAGLARGGRLPALSIADKHYIVKYGKLPGKMMEKKGLGGDILGGLGNMVAPGWGGHLGRGVGNAIGSMFGFRQGGGVGKF
jgi:hypothetical protein